MKALTRICCFVLLSLACTLPLWPMPALSAKDVLAVIVHNKSPVQSLSLSQLRSIFMGKRKTWENGGTIVAVNLLPKHPVRVLFDEAVLDMNPDEVGRYWVAQKIRAKGRPPQSVGAPIILRKIVAALPGAIGYVPIDLVDTSVKVVQIEGFDPKHAKYPIKKN